MVIDSDFGKMYAVSAERQGENWTDSVTRGESARMKRTYLWVMIRGMTKGTNKNDGKMGIKFKVPKVLFFIPMSL